LFVAATLTAKVDLPLVEEVLNWVEKKAIWWQVVNIVSPRHHSVDDNLGMMERSIIHDECALLQSSLLQNVH
jgi:hypothetical protein